MDFWYNIRNINGIGWEASDGAYQLQSALEVAYRSREKKAGSRTASLAKLGKGDNIITDVLLRIWEVMDCHIENILETTGE